MRAFAPPSPGRRAVVGWARRHACRTGARVEVLVDPPSTGTDRGPVGLLGRLVDRMSAALAGRHPLVDRLARASAGASMLVVPQRLCGVDALVDTAYEPVTVVPDEPAHANGPVVLALAPRTSDDAVDAAFDAAAHRGASLLAVRLRDPGWALSAGEDRAEAADEERRDWWDRLAAWRITRPGVRLEVHVAEGDPALELVDLSSRARLLVLGRSGRGRVLATVATSPVAAVTLRARCPVLVVPPAGPPRRSWWPRSS